VAARFPEPATKYATPAFEAGRNTWTSNAEVALWLRALVREGRSAPGSPTVRLLSPGNSQAGVPIEALLFTRLADATPAGLQRAGRPTVLLIGQQHGDEPAGAEALLAIAQDLAQGPLARLLEQINVVVLPRANPDAALAGLRNSASGIDPDRDHLLLRTPEAQAMAQLAREYRPSVVIDAHEYAAIKPYLEKFGALQRFDALLQYATVANLPEFITKAAEEWFRRPLLASLKAQGLSSEWLYTAALEGSEKKMSMGSVEPDSARNANGLRNAISFTIETRGVGLGRAHFGRRVHTHVVAIKSVLERAAQRAADLAQVRKFVDAEVNALACRGQATVAAATSSSEYTLTMLDPVSGADRQISVAWESALELEVRKSRARPCGYWLGEGQIDSVLRLRALGVVVQQIQQNGVVRGEVYRETARQTVPDSVRDSGVASGANETRLRVQVETVPSLIDAAAGSYYVPLDQPLAHLALAALEPDSPHGYTAHRILNALDGVARVTARPDWRMSALP
jgi:Zinc carboxypeptidase